MIKFVIENATDFSKAIDAIAVLIDEAEFLVDKEALTLKATDPSQISMVDFHMPKKAFKEYHVDQSTKIGVDLTHLKNILSRAKANDNLIVEVADKANVLNIQFQGTSKRSFSMPLIDVSGTELPTPKINFDADVKMKAALLQDALKDAALISTHVVLGVSADTFFVRANSTKGTLNHETNCKEKSIIEFNARAECKAMFPLDYLIDMIKGASSDSVLTVYLKKDAPVKISYNIGDASLNYFLAPRIESE